MPNYAILVDVRDRAGNQVTYVSEENLEVISNTRVCCSNNGLTVATLGKNYRE